MVKTETRFRFKDRFLCSDPGEFSRLHVSDMPQPDFGACTPNNIVWIFSNRSRRGTVFTNKLTRSENAGS